MVDQMIMNEKSIWEAIVPPSHEILFDSGYLIEMGAFFQQQFNGVDAPEKEIWPTIPRDACKFAQADQFLTSCSGFDLPTTITPKNGWNEKLVVFASQDPLRTKKKHGDVFSIATPWGFSNPNIRLKSANKKIWPTICWLCEQGYGAYFTDVNKLYLHKDAGKKLPETYVIENSVFKKEVKLIEPLLWVAMGRKAESVLCRRGISEYDYHPHPTARVKSEELHYQISDFTHEKVAEAFRKQVETSLNK